jgi:hypothetical protein
VSSTPQPPGSDPKNASRTPWALVLSVVALGAAVLVGLGLIAKEGTKADDENMWKK